jgi:hypothetical protein
MSLQVTEHDEADLNRIDSLIATTRRMLRTSWLFTGVALTIGLCITGLVIAACLDLVMSLSIPFRAAALIAIVVPTVLALSAGVVRPAMRRLSANHIARRIERLVPQIQSRLVTTLDVARSTAPGAGSPAFRHRLISETTERLTTFRPNAVVNGRHVKHAGVFAASVLCVAAIATLVLYDRIPTAIARILFPLADIPPVTGTHFVADPGNAKALKGDDVTIAAVVERGSPRAMTLEYRTDGGRWIREPMQPTDDHRFELTRARMEKSIEYRILGGGTWTTRKRIEVIDRPAIAGMHTELHFPEYMKLPEPIIGTPQSIDAAGPVGSRVDFVVDVAGSASTGEIQLLQPSIQSRPVEDRTERMWFEGKLPDGSQVEGNWQWDFALKFRAAHTDPAAGGQHAHGFHTANGFELRADDVIYAYVNVVPGQVPSEIMLQFYDGKDWEHRAYWGEDKIQAGTQNTVARVRIGEIPATDQWVRLEIPAAAVGLAGKKLHGISFMLFGGQCKWNRAGAVDPAEVPEQVLTVQSTNPIVPDADESGAERSNGTQRWKGSITLAQDAFYRLEFQNELGIKNKPMKEGKLTAIPDNPPQIQVERPGADLVLNQPQKVPIVVRASDDFGLSDITLAVQKGDSGGFVGAPIKVYDDPVRHDTAVGVLDLIPHQLKPGEFVRYRLQARDRKGQIAQTQELVVRIQQDPNAADAQLAAMTQQQATLEKRLEQLIGQQATITAAVEKAAGREPVTAMNEPKAQNGERQDSQKAAASDTPKTANSAASDTPKQPSVAADSAAPPAQVNPPLKAPELRQELNKLAGSQEANVNLAAQIQAEIAHTAAAASSSKLVPPQLTAQMRATEPLFQNEVAQPMRNLLESMRQAGDAQKPDPDAAAIADSAQRIQQELEAMRSRMQAIAKAQQRMRDDPAAALAQLKQDLTAQNAQLTAQEIAELRNYLDRLAGQMKMLEGKETELARQTTDAMPVMLPEIEREQSHIEDDAGRLLDQSQEVMDVENSRTKSPQRQDNAPQSPEIASKSAPNAGDDDEWMDLPGGAKPKSDPRSKKGSSPNDLAAAKPQTPPNSKQSPSQQPTASSKQAATQSEATRGQLARRQERTIQDLQTAQGQLQAPRDRMARLLEELRDALGTDDAEAAKQLAKIMESSDMNHAMQLAKALRQAQPQTETAKNKQPSKETLDPRFPATASELNAAILAGFEGEFGRNDVDLAAQAVMLKMQPRLREELLKGMREDGPEAYRKFIQDYFNRLTKVKGTP